MVTVLENRRMGQDCNTRFCLLEDVEILGAVP